MLDRYELDELLNDLEEKLGLECEYEEGRYELRSYEDRVRRYDDEDELDDDDDDGLDEFR